MVLIRGARVLHTHQSGLLVMFWQKRWFILLDSWMWAKVAWQKCQVFLKTFTIEDTTFKSNGIHLYNPDIFCDYVFLPVLITDIPLPHGDGILPAGAYQD